jgi:hypothetical protein
MEQRNFDPKDFDLGAFLHARYLAAVPGTLSIFYKADFSLTIVEAVPYDLNTQKRFKVSLSKLLTPNNNAGGFDVFISYKIEEIK